MRNLKQLTFTAITVIGLMAVASSAYSSELVLEQKDKSFQHNGDQVEALTINVGDVIRFQNEDPFFHNIFSLSDLRTFDLGSFPKGESKTITFDKPGLAEIECAIHPQMFLELTVK